MSKSIFTTANQFVAILTKRASGQIMDQIADVAAAATRMWQAREVWKNAALGSYDAEDVYDADQDAPNRAKSVTSIVDSIYFTAVGLKQNAAKFGMSSADVEQRKQSILGLCAKLSSITLPRSDPHAFDTLSAVRAAAERIVPAAVQAPASQTITFPDDHIQGKPPGEAAPQGQAYEDEWNPQSSNFYLKQQ